MRAGALQTAAARPLGRRGGLTGLETIGTGDLRRAIGHVSFERGLDYFERGMVRSVEFETPCRIHGRVSGSRSNLYSVLAVVALRADGRLLSIEGHCSCPVGFNCKHVAAVLLAAQEFSTDENGRGSGRARASVSGEVRQWLNRWPEPAAGRASNRPPGAVAGASVLRRPPGRDAARPRHALQGPSAEGRHHRHQFPGISQTESLPNRQIRHRGRRLDSRQARLLLR